MSVHSLGLLGSLVACAFAQSLNTQKKIAYDGVLSDISSGCPISGPASCHNSTVEENLCCFESPGVGAFISVPLVHTLISTPGSSPASAGKTVCRPITVLGITSAQFWDTNPPTGPADHWTIHGACFSLKIYGLYSRRYQVYGLTSQHLTWYLKETLTDAPHQQLRWQLLRKLRPISRLHKYQPSAFLVTKRLLVMTKASS
jgi:hypothetical protein